MPLASLIILAGLILSVGWLFPSRLLAWGSCVLGVVAAHWITLDETPLFRMLALVAILLFGMKSIVYAEYRLRGKPAVPWYYFLLFALFWLGMRPSTFVRRAGGPLPRWQSSAAIGGLCLAAGLATLFAARGHAILGMVGLSLTLHFGLMRCSTALFRLVGFPAYPLFLNPLRTRSLGEFWNRRWNLGYVEMTASCVYRPLKRFGDRTATIGAFLFSGILHEIAISLPVQAGYGLPTLYFLLQGMLVSATEVRGPLPALLCVAIPTPILFHPQFIEHVILPILPV